MALYLITGGAGFIGSHLAEELLRRGARVRVLDNFSTGKRENLAGLGPHFELIEGDIRSYHTVQQAVREVDYVLHQGALPSVPRSINDPITTNEVNVGGTLNLLDAARDAGVKRVVYASSSSVYGANNQVPKREDMTPQPISPYAVSKLTGEHYCQVFSRTYGLETVSLRYFNVFGPRQDPQSAYSAFIPKFAAGILRHQELTIDGDGTQSRDFTYVRNVVEANLLAATAPGVSGEIFNIACGARLSVNEVATHLAQLCGTQARLVHGPSRAGDVPHSLADISRAKKCLNYEPQVGAREGLAQVVAWFQNKFAVEGRSS
ncbi:MAG: SDR family oxidoreductase [Candidatus Latescibacteria bacterium]|nr:SDR family oxidoreductase [Candidatus Latescibacterota bacterium]